MDFLQQISVDVNVDENFRNFRNNPHANRPAVRIVNPRLVNLCCGYAEDLLQIFTIDFKGGVQIHNEILFILWILLWE